MYIETTQERNDAAVIASCESLAKQFRQTPLQQQNVKKLNTLAALLSERTEELAALMSEESNRPISVCRTECKRSVETIQKTIDALKQLNSKTHLDFTDALQGGAKASSERFSFSPLFVIVPFNFPINLALHKIAPAIALGLPFVCKPPKQHAGLYKKMHSLFCDAGLADDSFLIWMAKSDQVEDVLENIPFGLISFTGSTKVGLQLKKRFPERKFILELGGTAAAVVNDTENISSTALGLAKSAYGQAGQSCISTQHIFVKNSLYQSFLDSFQKQTMEFAVHTNPRDESTVCSALIDKNAKEKSDKIFQNARSFGFEIWQTEQHANNENYCPPSLLLCGKAKELSTAQTSFLREEFFAPIACLIPYDELDEALATLHKLDSNLHASIWSQNSQTVEKFFYSATARSVLHNQVPSWRADAMPYGGTYTPWQAYPQIHTGLLGNEGPLQTLLEYTIDRLLIEPVREKKV